MTVTAADGQVAAARGEQKIARRVANWLPGGLAVLVLLAYSGIGRPIWLDEALHFAMGGMTFPELLRTIDYTTIEINHGQTGAYLLADWLLLQAFGANAFALRLPSLISAALMLWAALYILRTVRIGILWQSIMMLAFASHVVLMSYTAEARPYMPLAGSAIAMLAYFITNPGQRSSFEPRTFAVFGLLVGSIMQAYWPLYLALAVLIGLVVQALNSNQVWVSWTRLRTYLALPYLLASTGLFFGVGLLTWMRWPREFAYDPFQWFGSFSGAVSVFVEDHLTFGLPASLWIVLGVATGIAVFLIRGQWREFVGPFLVLAGGLLSSIVISWLSYSRSYWVNTKAKR